VKLPLSALVLSIWLGTRVYAVDQQVAMDKTADAPSLARAGLQHLVESFQRAILEKNADAIRGMFLPGGSWFRVLDRTSLAAARAKKPEARQIDPGSYEEFAKLLGTTSAALEETVDNIRIEADGTVGMVYFDYRVIKDGRQTNHGVETWQVIRASDGWKISAMLYSVTDDIR
jgi:hypothetical protein